MPESYMIVFDFNDHRTEYILSMAVGERKVRDWWTEGEADDQPKERYIITLNAPEHIQVLEDLRKSGQS